MQEIERKFLLKNDSWRKQICSSCKILQGYIFFPAGIVRIRVSNNRAYLTLKTPNEGLVRKEFEYKIPMSDARDLLDNVCIKPLIEKTRHHKKSGRLVWNIDEFHGENSGLIITEVELKSENEKIRKPIWVGKEVTDNPIYYNSNLVHKPFSKWDPNDRLAGFRPKNYSPILDVKLKPDNCIGEEIKKIYARLLWIVEQNEKAIIEDLDPYFLHDLRVAIRKTRCLLKQFKSIFPQNKTQQFKKDFANITKHTNQLRDLDVFIQQKEAYHEELPQKQWETLEPLFEKLHSKRQHEYKTTVDLLNSHQYLALKKRWQNYLKNNDNSKEKGKLYIEPTQVAAKSKIKKAHRKVIKAGAEMNSKSSDKDFHALRIKCKNLRYLLESFQNLFDKKIISNLMKQLKSLQDNLGAANDISQQRKNIRLLISEYAKESNQESLTKTEESLLDLLASKQRKLREEFQEEFAVFSSEKNNQIFKKILKY